MSNNADKQKAERLVKAGFVGVMVYFAVIIGFFSLVGVVVVHFIAKFW